MFQYHCLNPIAEKGLGLFDEDYKKTGPDTDNKIKLLLDYTDRKGSSIADPWYSGNFVDTYRDVVEGCEGFLAYLESQHVI